MANTFVRMDTFVHSYEGTFEVIRYIPSKVNIKNYLRIDSHKKSVVFVARDRMGAIFSFVTLVIP